MGKLWEKEGTKLNREIEKFTIGNDCELDLLLAEHDILGTMAHVIMLSEVNLMEKEELDKLIPALKILHKKAKDGEFRIDEGVEDIHSQVELLLTQNLGKVGKKIHSGRSRNDQVLVDIRLFLRNQIKEIANLAKELGETLLTRSEETKDFLMPGYTHMQAAMPSSFGLWFGSFAESIADDLINLHAAHQIVNQNPLGSAAGYGSSFPLNRKLTASLLGFDNLNYNVVYAQQTRGKVEWSMANSMGSFSLTLNKLASDICTYMGQDYGFFTLPNEWITGSSIMPHKKNPDVAELIRGKTNYLIGLPQQIAMMITNLPTGYHREFQLLKDLLFPAILELKKLLKITNGLVNNLQVSDDLLKQDKYKYLFSVEEVNKLVLEGVPFREAYKVVGNSIEKEEFFPTSVLNHTSEGTLGNLCNNLIKKKLYKNYVAFGFEDWLDKIKELSNFQNW